MASFTANFFKTYDGTTGEQNSGRFGLASDFDTITSILNDGESDETFEIDSNGPDMFAGSIGEMSPGDMAYRGTFNVTVDGTSYPVFVGQILPSGPLFVFGNIPGISSDPLPTSLGPVGARIFSTDPFTVCFAAGTLIATPTGDIAVEALVIGDLVLTADGRAVPVKWLGRQTLAPLFQPVRLIRVAAGALGIGLPLRDLTVTADHALMIDGLLVNAGALVNGRTITVVKDLPERVTVYHVETGEHDIILAEGTPTETFIDYAGRRVFDNYAEYLTLYGADRAMPEHPAPRVSAARMLPPAIRARLSIDRAA